MGEAGYLNVSDPRFAFAQPKSSWNITAQKNEVFHTKQPIKRQPKEHKNDP